ILPPLSPTSSMFHGTASGPSPTPDGVRSNPRGHASGPVLRHPAPGETRAPRPSWPERENPFCPAPCACGSFRTQRACAVAGRAERPFPVPDARVRIGDSPPLLSAMVQSSAARSCLLFPCHSLLGDWIQLQLILTVSPRKVK